MKLSRLAALLFAFVCLFTISSFAQTVVSVSITPLSPQVPKGRSQTFKATAKLSNGQTIYVTHLATWSSSNTGVATIGANAGTGSSATQTVNTLTEGTTTITATYQTVPGTTSLKVNPAVVDTIAVVASGDGAVAAGGAAGAPATQEQYNATVTYTDGTQLTGTTANNFVSWSTSATATATVSNATPTKGLATGQVNGTAQVRASYGAVIGSAPIVVGTGTGGPLVTVTLTGAAGGAVSSSPAGIACGNNGTSTGTLCANTFPSGGNVVLTAAPISGGTFTGWGGACLPAGTNLQCTLTSVTSAKTVTAGFKLPLTLSKAGAGFGTVTSSPAGISCLAACSGQTAPFNPGATVVLTATPATGSTFAGWTGACTNATGSCSVTMDAAKTVTATFNAITYPLNVSVVGTGSGSVASDVDGTGGGIECPGVCSDNYASGTNVTLTATPNTGSVFTSWTGCASVTNVCTVPMTAARNVGANFTIQSFTLAVEKSGTGDGTVSSSPSGILCGIDCSQTFNYGTEVTLTATVSEGSTFASWTGCDSSEAESCTVTMDGDVTVTATFDEEAAAVFPQFAFTANGSESISQFVVDGDSGKLFANGMFDLGSDSECGLNIDPQDITAHPNGAFVYAVAEQDEGCETDDAVVLTFAVGSDGRLSQLGSPIVVGGEWGRAMAMDPQGRFLYTASLADGCLWGCGPMEATVTVFEIETDGTLTQSDTEEMSSARALHAHSSGEWLLVAHDVYDCTDDFCTIVSQLSSYSVDQSTGALTLADTVETGDAGHGIAEHYSGDYIFLAAALDLAVESFSFNTTDGSLAFVNSVYAEGNPITLTAHPSAGFVYAGTRPEDGDTVQGGVRVFSVSAVTGEVTAGQVVYDHGAFDVLVDPSEQWLYAVSRGLGAVTQYSIDVVNETHLTRVSRLDQVDGPVAITMTAGTEPVSMLPTQAYIVTNNLDADTSSVTRYTINPETGALTQGASTAAAHGDTSELLTDSQGRALFLAHDIVSEGFETNLSGFAIGEAGALGGLPGSPFETPGNGVVDAVLSPSDDFGVVATSEGALYMFGIGPDGAPDFLAAEEGPVFPSAPATALAHDGENVYVATPNGLFEYHNDDTETLHNDCEGPYGFEFNNFAAPISVARLGQFVAVGYDSAVVGAASIVVVEQDSCLSYVWQEGGIGVNSPVVALAATSGGDRLFAVLGNGTVISYGVGDPYNDPQMLTEVNRVSAGSNPVDAAVDISDSFLYVVNSGSDSISIFSIAADGTLAAVGDPVSTPANPRAIVLHGSIEGVISPFVPDTDDDGDPNTTDTDDDNDGIPDGEDACPLRANEGVDSDEDTIDNACDPDDDNDGVRDVSDNCRFIENPDQADDDEDGDGDACEDDDGDGVIDTLDNCVFDYNPGQENNFGEDFEGDVCDDTDGDGNNDAYDSCPLDLNNDSDGDGACDSADPCPEDSDDLCVILTSTPRPQQLYVEALSNTPGALRRVAARIDSAPRLALPFKSGAVKTLSAKEQNAAVNLAKADCGGRAVGSKAFQKVNRRMQRTPKLEMPVIATGGAKAGIAGF